MSKSMERVDARDVSQLMAFGGMVDCAVVSRIHNSSRIKSIPDQHRLLSTGE